MATLFLCSRLITITRLPPLMLFNDLWTSCSAYPLPLTKRRDLSQALSPSRPRRLPSSWGFLPRLILEWLRMPYCAPAELEQRGFSGHRCRACVLSCRFSIFPFLSFSSYISKSLASFQNFKTSKILRDHLLLLSVDGFLFICVHVGVSKEY